MTQNWRRYFICLLITIGPLGIWMTYGDEKTDGSG